MIRDHFLDRRKLEFPALVTAEGWVRRRGSAERSGLVTDGPMRPILVVVPDPSLHFFGPRPQASGTNACSGTRSGSDR